MIKTGSTSLILKAPQYIAIAADSKVVSNGEKFEDAGSICKIKLVNDFAYTNTGLFKDQFGILDVDLIVQSAAESSNNLYDIYNKVVAEILIKLPQSIASIKETNPKCYTDYILDKSNAISIAFIGKVNGQKHNICKPFC